MINNTRLQLFLLLMGIIFMSIIGYSGMPDRVEVMVLTTMPGQAGVLIAAQAQPAPTLTPSPTLNAAPTLGEPNPLDNRLNEPYRHVIREQDVLSIIIQRYGYAYDPSDPAIIALIAEIVRLNDNIPNPDILPGVGSEILIPRQTATPINNVDDSLPPADSPFVNETSTPTPDPNAPIPYQVREGDNLIGIIQSFNYPNSPELIATIVRMNPNIRDENTLPGAGSEIFLPRKTATPIPEGIDLTLTVEAGLGLERLGSVTLPQNTPIECYIVQEGDTIVGIAGRYNTTLEVLSQLNQQLNWSGCNFSVYSGGENCAPILRTDECVNVPLPTPVPTNTPTPSGSETPTATPTRLAPRGVYPPDGAVAPAGIFNLQWVSVGVLVDEEEVYLVEIQDLTTNTNTSYVTRLTTFTLPDNLVPTDAQTHSIQWRVSVARQGVSGAYNYVGGIGDWRTFEWQSR